MLSLTQAQTLPLTVDCYIYEKPERISLGEAIERPVPWYATYTFSSRFYVINQLLYLKKKKERKNTRRIVFPISIFL